MDPFTYTDIFDTKGIEYIIVIFFLLLIVPFWRWLVRPVKQEVPAEKAAPALSADLLKVPQGLFFNKNHTWSILEQSGAARIGVDDLLLHLTGGVDVGFLRREGERIRKGDPLFRLSRDGKSLVLGAPVSGTLERVNDQLSNQMKPLSEDPYTNWLCKLNPENWQGETAGCHLADRASSWMKEELLRFKDFLSGALSAEKTGPATVVMQEGGELTAFPLAMLDENAWKQFQEKFLEDRS